MFLINNPMMFSFLAILLFSDAATLLESDPDNEAIADSFLMELISHLSLEAAMNQMVEIDM